MNDLPSEIENVFFIPTMLIGHEAEITPKFEPRPLNSTATVCQNRQKQQPQPQQWQPQKQQQQQQQQPTR